MGALMGQTLKVWLCPHPSNRRWIGELGSELHRIVAQTDSAPRELSLSGCPSTSWDLRPRDSTLDPTELGSAWPCWLVAFLPSTE